jgi:hypothetical protein
VNQAQFAVTGIITDVHAKRSKDGPYTVLKVEMPGTESLTRLGGLLHAGLVNIVMVPRQLAFEDVDTETGEVREEAPTGQGVNT